MSLQIHTPSPALRPSVTMMWYWKGYHPPHTHERILPFGSMELTFNLTDESMCFAYPEKGYRPHSLRGAIVSGVHSRFFVVETRRPASILSVLFEPGAAHQCFGIPAGELHNQHVPLRELWGSEADALYERLMTTSTIDERFSILERHLLERLRRAAEPHRAISFALRSLNYGLGTPSIADVVNQLALSPTRFIQVFQAEVGLTPKRFCQVQRFQKALRLIARHPSTSWTEVALAAGYYDQSHFINEFRRFAGITPTQFAPQSAEHPGNLPFFELG